MVVRLSPDELQAMVTEWQEQVRNLLDEVERWARSKAWSVTRTETPIHEDGLPKYTTAILDIRVTGERRVYLEPIARRTLNGRGVVDLYGWPSLRRVRLQPSGSGSWVVMTDSGIPLRQDWNCENFVTLVDDLVAR